MRRSVREQGVRSGVAFYRSAKDLCLNASINSRGQNVSPSAAYSDRGELTADLITEPAAPDIVPMKRGTPDEPAKQIQTFTREELESIADNEGIAGLRVIGNQVGVKAKGIVEMIEGILKAQGGE